ncbi:hypothetical protein DFJ74DRAFT_775321 [Hyaloraphidium curvatum]|nr:hypothetical protein DFJ74DRAFT_775321 [Hyaloraphidium curvatum]
MASQDPPSDGPPAEAPGPGSLPRLSAVLSGVRAASLLARPITDSVWSWQKWGTQLGFGIARAATGALPGAHEVLGAAEGAALTGIAAVGAVVGASLDASAAALGLANAALPMSDDERRAAALGPVGLVERFLELLNSDDVSLTGEDGSPEGAVKTVAKLWAWGRIVHHSEAAWRDMVIMDGLAAPLADFSQSATGGPGADPVPAGEPAPVTMPSSVQVTSAPAGTEDYDVVAGTIAEKEPVADHAGGLNAPTDVFDLLASSDPKHLPAQLKELHRLSRLCTGSYGEVLARFLGLTGGTKALPGTRPAAQAPEAPAEAIHPSHAYLAQAADISHSDILHSTHTILPGRSLLGTYHPLLFLLRDPARRALTVVFRGTLEAPDVLVDLAASAADFGAGTAHGAMLDAAMHLARPSSPFLAAVRAALEPGWGIILAGHSLGAALASLLALLLPPLFPGVRVFAVALAPPCVVSVDVPAANVLSLVLEDDLVPRLSHSAVRESKLALNGLRIDLADLALRDARVTNLPGTALDADRTYFLAARLAALRAAFGSSYPPVERATLRPAGRVWWIRGREVLLARDARALGGLALSAGGVARHMPDRYERRLGVLEALAGAGN